MLADKGLVALFVLAGFIGLLVIAAAVSRFLGVICRPTPMPPRVPVTESGCCSYCLTWSADECAGCRGRC